jgi:hypothetical protein
MEILNVISESLGVLLCVNMTSLIHVNASVWNIRMSYLINVVLKQISFFVLFINDARY